MTKAQLEKALDEWQGMYRVAQSRESVLATALRVIANWYDGESDFSGDTPTSYAKDTLDTVYGRKG